MPLDFRRFTGPEDSISYTKFTEHFVKSYDDLFKEVINEKGLRKDGRALNEAGTIFARTDMVSQAKGSAYVERNQTKVVCSVFDPREIPHQNEFSQLGQIYCEVKYAPFSCPRKRRGFQPDAEEKELSVALRQALEPTVCRHMFPNFQVDVFVYILENDGGCLAAAINAAGLALTSAAVPLYDMITSCTVGIIGKHIVIEPTEEEEHLAMMSPEDQGNHGIITMSMLTELQQVSDIRQIGSLDVECITQAMDLLEIECRNIIPNIHKAVVSDILRCFERRMWLDEEAKVRDQLLDAKMEKWKDILNKN